MASLQADAIQAEDVITETEASGKEPQVVAPPLPPPAAAEESVRTVNVEDEEDDLEVLTAPPYEEKFEISDEEEEKDTEYSLFMEREDEPPVRPAGEPRPFGDFDEDDYEEFEDKD